MGTSGVIGQRPAGKRRRHGRRRRLLTRALPLAVAAVAAFAVGAVVGSGPQRAARAVVQRYVTDWARDDVGGMYGLLDRASRARLGEPAFARELHQAAMTATLRSLRLVRVGSRHRGVYAVATVVRTRVWGALRETLLVPLTGTGGGARVHFTSELLFPGLRPGERLARRIVMAPRATIQAADGTPLAEGPDRSSPIPDVASAITGVLGPIPAGESAAYAARGYPADARVGLDGLERIFQDQLAGRPGGSLRAGRRVLASVPAVPGTTVRTTISPSLERAANAALGGQYGGIVVMSPRTGAVEAAAGIAFSDAQPPGSTMKIITSTALLTAGIASLSSTFPIETAATIDGYTLHNDANEACGGTLLNAFAVSCNSVFAPLGAQLGAARLVSMAIRYGFDQPPPFTDAAPSTIPSPQKMGDALAVGSSAIGQGEVQATPLEMADVAATIAMGGRRPIPTLRYGQAPRFVPVTSRHIASEVEQMMEAVVSYGTGTAAQIPGVTVAGKTGTAEIANTVNPNLPNPKNTDAWFVGYGPVGHPTVVAGALFPNQGAGGAAAAPAVRDVLVAALGR